MRSILLKNTYYKNNMNLVITPLLILILLSTPLLAYGLTCPVGTHIGRDNEGKESCIDIKTNNIVDPKTGIQYDPHSGEPVVKGEEIDSTRAVIIGIVIFVIFILLIKAFMGGGQKNETPHYQYKTPQQWKYELQESAKARQGGKCAMCSKMPNKWEFKIKQHEDTRSLMYGYCSDCIHVSD